MDKELLEKLRQLPDQDVYAQIAQLPKPGFRAKKTQYASVLDKLDNRIIERVYAFRYFRNKLQIKEVIRRCEGFDYILVRDTGLSWNGYNTYWENNYRWSGAWFIEDFKYYIIPTYMLFDINTLIELDPSLKYCGWTKGAGNVIVFINLYRKYPEIEYLAKFGIFRLSYSKAFLEKLKKDKEFKKWIVKNLDDIKTNIFITYTIINTAYKYKISIRDSENLSKIKKRLKEGHLPEKFKDQQFQIVEYLRKQNKDANYYFDYMNMVLRFVSRDEFFSKPKYMFPKNLEEKHNYYMKVINELERKKKEKENQKFLAVSKKYESFEFLWNGLIAILPKDNIDLIEEGKALHHCVGSVTSYYQNHMNEINLIAFIRKTDEINKPYYTVEFRLSNLEIIQCRTLNNGPATEEINAFLEKWKEHMVKCKRKIEKTKKVA